MGNDRGQYGHLTCLGTSVQHWEQSCKRARPWGLDTSALRGIVGQEPDPPSKTPWWKIALGATAALGVGYLVLVRPSMKAGDRRLAEARQLASDVGLKYGMSEEEKDRAFDAYYKKKGYPSYLLSTAPKWTT